MEPESSLPHSQVPAIWPYPEPPRSSPYLHIPLPEDPYESHSICNVYVCIYIYIFVFTKVIILESLNCVLFLVMRILNVIGSYAIRVREVG
jgi:hypothetical protein